MVGEGETGGVPLVVMVATATIPIDFCKTD
jgi:hypothetical protein